MENDLELLKKCITDLKTQGQNLFDDSLKKLREKISQLNDQNELIVKLKSLLEELKVKQKDFDNLKNENEELRNALNQFAVDESKFFNFSYFQKNFQAQNLLIICFRNFKNKKRKL